MKIKIENKKGCVYFFKHVGLDPIKIGFSTNESPIFRFEQFKTYAPFGAELIGFIRTNNAKKLETELHLKFSSKRLIGEWFEISRSEVDNCIKFYSNIEDIQEMNNFQVAWAKSLDNNFLEDNIGFYNHFSFIENDSFNVKKILNLSELVLIIGCKKDEAKIFLKKMKCEYKARRSNGLTKKGYLFYAKNEN